MKGIGYQMSSCNLKTSRTFVGNELNRRFFFDKFCDLKTGHCCFLKMTLTNTAVRSSPTSRLALKISLKVSGNKLLIQFYVNLRAVHSELGFSKVADYCNLIL